VYNIMKGKKIAIEELAEKANLAIGTVMTTITMLEIKGLCKKLLGGMVVAVRK